MYRGVILLLGLFATPAMAQSESLDLFCQGTHGSNDSQPTVGVIASKGGNSYAVGSETVRRSANDTAYIEINEDDTGRVKLPPGFNPPIFSAAKDGWHQLIKIVRRDNEIVGRVRLTGSNKPKFRLDRISGTFNVSDGFDDFSGTCTPYDPERVEKRF